MDEGDGPAIERIYRQGDVILAKLSDGADDDTVVDPGQPTDNLVLALGEATGHAHRLHGPVVVLEPDQGDGRILFRVDDPVTVTHEEHRPLVLESGTYVKVDQVEYNPYGQRRQRRVSD